jgi:hypothetical protein
MKRLVGILLAVSLLVCVGCEDSSQEGKDRDAVQSQQSQYAKRQPIPVFDWSLERHLVSELYKIRNKKVATHAVWRSNYGVVEGDCPCLGYGIPYDTSLTNPLQVTRQDLGTRMVDWVYGVIEQPEPNGIYASKNTSATWVMCLGQGGSIEPVYVESKVTIYPGPVKVNYANNRVTRSGAATVLISSK